MTRQKRSLPLARWRAWLRKLEKRQYVNYCCGQGVAILYSHHCSSQGLGKPCQIVDNGVLSWSRASIDHCTVKSLPSFDAAHQVDRLQLLLRCQRYRQNLMLQEFLTRPQWCHLASSHSCEVELAPPMIGGASLQLLDTSKCKSLACSHANESHWPSYIPP